MCVVFLLMCVIWNEGGVLLLLFYASSRFEFSRRRKACDGVSLFFLCFFIMCCLIEGIVVCFDVVVFVDVFGGV